MGVGGLTCDAISVPVGSLGRIWASPSVLTLEGAGPVCDDRFRGAAVTPLKLANKKGNQHVELHSPKISQAIFF